MRHVTPREPAAEEPIARAFLRDLIAREGGSISFERFMREALYHPRFGYYTRQVRTVGGNGDFSTSATLHGALGVAVAAWAARRRSGFGWRSPWHVIELGGGNGQLADRVLRSLGWWARRGVRYHVVERSETLRREQQTLLARWPAVFWHEDIAGALRAADGRALIVSNEFVDAFPCVRLERDGSGGWRELRVEWHPETGTFAECCRPWEPSTEETGDAASAVFAPEHAASLAPGQRVEWHREYLCWLRAWTPLWRAGCLLTIDYGDELPALYHRRPGGTLRAYHQHQRLAGPEIHARIGRQDLTADVNFTDLRNWGIVLGLSETSYCRQAEFLRRWLPPKYLRRHGRELRLAFLLDEAGAGGAFKVLEQRRG